MTLPQAKIGVIGGSGLYEIEGLTDLQSVNIETPFGKPSDAITVGKLEGVGIAFLPRHGKGHRILPSDVPYKANIMALKSLGVEQIIAVNAVGSFKEELKPGDLIIPNQLIDRTFLRPATFFGEGIVAHIAFADPFCPDLSGILCTAAEKAGIGVHKGGTYVVMEGPAFSTRAESRLYKSWGADIIGMTALPEAKLAREAEICYSIIAGITDYDSWREVSEELEVTRIIEILNRNTGNIKEIIRQAVRLIGKTRQCECASALKNAIVTRSDLVPAQVKKKLSLIIGKYIPVTYQA